MKSLTRKSVCCCVEGDTVYEQRISLPAGNVKLKSSFIIRLVYQCSSPPRRHILSHTGTTVAGISSRA